MIYQFYLLLLSTPVSIIICVGIELVVYKSSSCLSDMDIRGCWTYKLWHQRLAFPGDGSEAERSLSLALLSCFSTCCSCVAHKFLYFDMPSTDASSLDEDSLISSCVLLCYFEKPTMCHDAIYVSLPGLLRLWVSAASMRLQCCDEQRLWHCPSSVVVNSAAHLRPLHRDFIGTVFCFCFCTLEVFGDFFRTFEASVD